MLLPISMELHQNTTFKAGFQYLTYSDKKSGILNEWQLGLFEIINMVVISAPISVFGIVANIINIIVFLKQGFINTVNISLFGLAISDLLCLISVMLTGVWFNPFMSSSDVPVVSLEVGYLTGACLHAFTCRNTSYITVYVTAERCLCILFPLKIKQLVTPKRTVTVICCIFITNFLTVVPEYATSYLDWKFFPETNKTLLSIAYISGREQAMAAVFVLFFFTGMLSFVALIVFTVTLAFKLQQSSEWRKEATSTSESSSRKEQKTIKMIVVIATVLIASNFPGAVLCVASIIEPEFNLRGQYYRLCTALWTITYTFESINSSINILFYYCMSSNYKKTFDLIFGVQEGYKFTTRVRR